jgi:hypothetical protein
MGHRQCLAGSAWTAVVAIDLCYLSPLKLGFPLRRAPPFPLRKNCCLLANCSFAIVFTSPKLAELHQLGHNAGTEQQYSSPTNGPLKQTVGQLRAA